MKRLALVALLLFIATAFYSKNIKTADPADIIDTATAQGLTKFVAAVALSELTESAKAQKPPAPFTVFAPNDAAFAAATSIAQTKAALRPVMKFHVVPGKKVEKGALAAGKLESISGSKIEVISATQVKGASETANIVGEGIPCNNGIIYVIDKVLTPTKE